MSRSEFARIFEVYGDKAKAYVTLQPNDAFELKNGRYEKIGIVGHHVVIPMGSSRLVARIAAITANDPNFSVMDKSKLPNFLSLQRILELDFVGSIETKKGKLVFDKGIHSYPTADTPVYSILDEELRLLFLGEEGRDSLLLGDLTESIGESVYIDTEKLFQGHFAVLGSTGSGKTCTLVHLLQSVISNTDYKSSHFVVLDPHGEYGKSFDNEEFKDKVRLIKFNSNEHKYKHLTPIFSDLPHYFFSFSEYKTLYRPAPQTHEPSLRDAIGRVRIDANNLNGKNNDNTVVADQPLQFDIKDLYRFLYGKKDGNGNSYLGSLAYRVQVLAAQPELNFLFNPQTGYDAFDDLLKALLGFDEHGNFYPVTIVDLSEIPRILNLLTTITNLLARMLYDKLRVNPQRGEKHCCIVLEEAHNYVPRNFNIYDRSSEHDFTLSTFETIAKEGRKYGTCLAVSSQRPRDLSETLISQCSSFFIHRLSNIGDKDIIRSAASNVEINLLNRMPVLAKQICIVMGDAIKSAAEVRISVLKYEPDSNSSKINKIWRREVKLEDFFESQNDENDFGDFFSDNDEIPF